MGTRVRLLKLNVAYRQREEVFGTIGISPDPNSLRMSAQTWHAPTGRETTTKAAYASTEGPVNRHQ